MERDIDDLPKNEANYTSLIPLWFLKRAALVHPNRRSVVHLSVQYTWQQTYRRCCRLASALSKHSVGFGSTELLGLYGSGYWKLVMGLEISVADGLRVQTKYGSHHIKVSNSVQLWS